MHDSTFLMKCDTLLVHAGGTPTSSLPVSHANGQLSNSVCSVTFRSITLYLNLSSGNIRKRKTNRIKSGIPARTSILKRGLHYKWELYIGHKGCPEPREYHEISIIYK